MAWATTLVQLGSGTILFAKPESPTDTKKIHVTKKDTTRLMPVSLMITAPC